MMIFEKQPVQFLLLLLLFISPGLQVFSQQAKQLTLQEAIELSIHNSHKLSAAQARIRQAIAVLKQAKENRLPEASVTGSLLWLNNPDLSLKTQKSQNGNDSATSFPSINEAAYGLINVSLPVFTGGKIKYGIESARYLQKAATLQSSGDTAAVILNTINAYTNLYKAIETEKVVHQNLSQSMHRDSIFRRLENNGLLARNDRLKAALQTSNLEVSLLEAQNNVKISNMAMDLLLGLPENMVLEIDSASFQLPENPETITVLQQYSMQHRKDLLSIQQRENAASAGISLAKASWSPDIAITAGYMAAYVPKVLTLTNAINAGVGIKYNISSLWKAKSKIEEATAKLKEIEANELQLRDAIRLQVNQDFENYYLERKKLTVYQNAIAQAEENYRITKNKFDNELANTQELLDADLVLLQSKIQWAVARADLFLSYHKLLQTAGKLSQ